MAAYKNDVKLGAPVAKGLHCPFCWAASMAETGSDVTRLLVIIRRVSSAPAPAPLTEEEVAIAIAWDAANNPPSSDDEDDQ